MAIWHHVWRLSPSQKTTEQDAWYAVWHTLRPVIFPETTTPGAVRWPTLASRRRTTGPTIPSDGLEQSYGHVLYDGPAVHWPD